MSAASGMRKLVAASVPAHAAWALTGSGLESAGWGAVPVALGWPVYRWQRRRIA